MLYLHQVIVGQNLYHMCIVDMRSLFSTVKKGRLELLGSTLVRLLLYRFNIK